MSKIQTLVRLLAAGAIIVSVQMPANAQFKGLAKKAKKAVGIEQSQESSNNSASSNSGSKAAPSAKKAKTLQSLDPELFIYPADDAANADFYDINSPKVQEGYAKYLETMSPGCPNQDPYGAHWLTEFETWESPKGARQIHPSEYPLTAFYSYFFLNLDTPEGYICYSRASQLQDNFLAGLFRMFPRIRNDRGWTDKYPRAEESRKVAIEEFDGELYLYETEEKRSQRWNDVQSEAEDILRQSTSYKTVRDAMRIMIDQMKQLDKEGQHADCYNMYNVLTRMKSNVESLSANYGQFNTDFKADEDDGWQDILDDINPLINRYDVYFKAAQTSSSSVAPMPKAANVSAEIQNEATARAKAKFGSAFVKAIVVEPDWHVYTDPNNFNRTSHRSIAVDVITKEGNDYIVNHQDLRQSYNGGSWGGYDMRNTTHMPMRSKVDYK